MESAAPDQPVEATSEGRPGLGRRALGWLTEGVLIVVGAVVIATLLRTFVGQMFVIPSGSMQNTLQIQDRVLVAKFGGFQRGDVVVFEDPGSWLIPSPPVTNKVQIALEFIGVLPNSGTEHLIKRVIGMPGDHVRVADDGRIEVNGVELDESSYLYSEGGVTVAPANVPFDIVVPKDRIFVMGDHRNESNDSRCRLANVSASPGASAFVPVEKVVGAAVAIVSPLDRLATFNVPETFEAVPDPTEPAPDEPDLIHVEPGC
ncbi:signal peptidase I [Tessaracoccus bendigoensis DSM 12906]|uniref:Signal peptidase I n=1 Tax=Tessaracoccus bendigoensis DSM 12906 TaxID=1123357 RepID=A0A1M6H9K9_9ACTN|nr:signal peptidase I [Tessaracoccus bendigoensis]SHJ18865.1 signal peptidase I [Tessaracoccus bendigoensis DSM 12906]